MKSGMTAVLRAVLSIEIRRGGVLFFLLVGSLA